MVMIFPRGIMRGFFVIAAMSMYVTSVFSNYASASIVFVEAVVKNEQSSGYRLVHLNDRGGKRELIVLPKGPVELIECHDDKVTYVDRTGGIWSIALRGTPPKFLAKTTSFYKEEMVGKVVYLRDE